MELVLFTCLCLFTYFITAVQVGPDAKYFQHETVYPEVSSRKDVKIVFIPTRYENFTLLLKLNSDLVSKNFHTKIFHASRSYSSAALQKKLHCSFTGHVEGYPDSTASVTLCGGVYSTFNVADQVYFLNPAANHSTGAHIFLPSYSYDWTKFKCGTENDNIGHFKRKRSIRWPYDTNKDTRILELYLVNDKAMVDKFKGDVDKVMERSLAIANTVNSRYRVLNIYVVLVGIEIWFDKDRIDVLPNADATMNNFLDYRKKNITQRVHHDNAQLITGIVFSDGIVGKAVKTTICSWMYSGGVNMDHSESYGPVSTTVAHEVGHNFGMKHDVPDECDCPDDRCIMAASSGPLNPTHWSSCSKDDLSDTFYQGLDFCLKNLPAASLKPRCGNGFKEVGEECDCGLPEDCTTHCCNPRSCQLMANASCATGSCCDLSTCQLQPATYPCRPSTSECDLPEYCKGVSEFCPFDVFLHNGHPCDSKRGYCYNGTCPSHQAQCKLLWGSSAENSNELCYNFFNGKGDVNGNCGYDWPSNRYKNCSHKEDYVCGMLHCTHRAEKLAFWTDALVHLFPNGHVQVGNKRFECHSAILDTGLDMPDPGMTQDGTKCGIDKMCIHQRCLNISIFSHSKLPNCNDNGMPNSLGGCHCKYGYKPPDCIYPGAGGSLHSGPMSPPSQGNSVTVGLVVFFVVVLPSLALLAYCSYRHQYKLQKLCRSLHTRYLNVSNRKHAGAQSSASCSRKMSLRDMPISQPHLQSSTLHCSPRAHNEQAASNMPASRPPPLEPPPRSISEQPPRPPPPVYANSLSFRKGPAPEVHYVPTRPAPSPPKENKMKPMLPPKPSYVKLGGSSDC